MVAVFLFSLIISLYRPVFLQLFLSAAYICWYFIKEEHNFAPGMMFYGSLAGLAVILDAVWLILYANELWNTPYVDDSSHTSLRYCTIILSVLLVVIETAACFLGVSLGLNEPLLTHRY
jgi:hypothetical protein